jgi:dTDP-4-amino-4,6-dideoxy-D-galactose acyltransferase
VSLEAEEGALRSSVDGAVLDAAVVAWDSAAFGFRVAAVSRFEIAPSSDPEPALDALERWCVERDVRVVSCRLDHTRLRESMALEARGFRFVEMVYQPRLTDLATRSIATPALEITIEPATDRDLPEIEAMAHDVFVTGRYELDPRLDPEGGRTRYANWVRNAVAGTTQSVLAARVRSELVGFFIVERRSDERVYWHLTAVAPQSQRRGIGKALWLTMLRRHRDEGAAEVETTISGHNLAALNLYARLGFALGSAQMTFHWLREPAP